MLIPVAAPRLWWRTIAGNVRRWVPVYPDVEDGYQWHADRDEQRWPLIASAVARVCDALAVGAWQVDPAVGGRGPVALDGYPADLTRTERAIVSAWFSSAEAVQFDPWFEPLTNGRHRLWATMPHFGTRLIPIRGDALGYVNPADTEVMGAGWADVYAVDVEELDGLDWFDAADPLNATFRAALVTRRVRRVPLYRRPATAESRAAGRCSCASGQAQAVAVRDVMVVSPGSTAGPVKARADRPENPAVTPALTRAAVELLTTGEKVTVEGVCRRARVSRPVFYRRFPTRTRWCPSSSLNASPDCASRTPALSPGMCGRCWGRGGSC